MRQWMGSALARYLGAPGHTASIGFPTDMVLLAACVRPVPLAAFTGLDCQDCMRQILHVRHHSLYTPRDFDVSPYFQVVKPTLEAGFDHHRLAWA